MVREWMDTAMEGPGSDGSDLCETAISGELHRVDQDAASRLFFRVMKTTLENYGAALG